MDINRLNYEVHVIDYIEGRMNAEDKAAFDAFLLSNPMIKEEIEEYMKAPLITEDTNVIYERKEFSKKRRNLLPWFSILSLALLGIIFFINQNPISINDNLRHGQPEQLDYNKVKQLEHSQSKKIEQPELKSTQAIQHLPPMANQEISPDTNKNDSFYPQTTSTRGVEKQAASEIKINSEVIASTSATPTFPKPNSIASPNESIQTSTIIPEPSLASVDSEETQTTKLINSSTPIANVTPIQELNKRGLTLLEGKNRRIELVVAVNRKEKKSPNWKNLLVPQSFEEIDISQSFATDNLKSAVRDVKEALIPESFTK